MIRKPKSTITWTNKEDYKWLKKQAGSKRAIGGYVRTVVSLMREGVIMSSNGGGVTAVRGRELTAAEIKASKGKGKKAPMIQTVQASPQDFANLMSELKSHPAFSKNMASVSLVKEMRQEANIIKQELTSAYDAPNPPA